MFFFYFLCCAKYQTPVYCTVYTLHLQVMRLENVGLRSQASWNTDSSTILTLLKGLSNEIFPACLSVDLHFLWSLFRIKAIKKLPGIKTIHPWNGNPVFKSIKILNYAKHLFKWSLVSRIFLYFIFLKETETKWTLTSRLWFSQKITIFKSLFCLFQLSQPVFAWKRNWRSYPRGRNICPWRGRTGCGLGLRRADCSCRVCTAPAGRPRSPPRTGRTAALQIRACARVFHRKRKGGFPPQILQISWS